MSALLAKLSNTTTTHRIMIAAGFVTLAASGISAQLRNTDKPATTNPPVRGVDPGRATDGPPDERFDERSVRRIGRDPARR